MKKYFKEHENKIVTVLFVLTMIIACSPLISRYCINGHDLDYHLLRIEALKENILIGRPFMKINPLFFGGAGYASSMFYSDFLLYIPALLRAANVSINASYHIFAALCMIMCFASAYYCVWKITASKYAGAIAGILLTLCPYHMDDIMVRAAVGEYMAFIFVPFVIYGIYNVLYEEMDKPWIIGIGFGAVLLSHTATTVMCIMFAMAAFVIKIKVFIKSPKIIGRLVITAIITMCATAFMWLPMLEQFLSTGFSVTTGESIDMLDAAVDFSQVLSQQFPTIGIMLILLAIPRLFVKKSEDSVLEYADWMLVGAAVFAILSTNLLPWNLLSRVLSFIQFPWRFYLIASVLLAMADAVILKSFALKIAEGFRIEGLGEVIWDIIIVIVFVAMAGLSLTHQSENTQGYYDYSNDYYSYKPYTTNVIGGEWLPESVTDRDRLLQQSEEMTASDGSSVEFVRNRGKVIADVAASVDYVEAPLIYYKGYSAVMNNGTQQKLAVSGEGDNGMCRVYTAGQTGELTVNYAGTTVQWISYIVSILAIAGVIAAAIYNKGKDGEESK